MIEDADDGQEHEAQDPLAGTELGKLLRINRVKSDDAMEAIECLKKYLVLDDGGEARGEGQATTPLAEVEKFLRIDDAGRIPNALLKRLAKEKELRKVLAQSLAKRRPMSLDAFLAWLSKSSKWGSAPRAQGFHK